MRVALLLCALLAGPAMAQSHEHHADHAMPAAGPQPTAAPTPPTDHAADRHFDPTVMAAARAALFHEHGAMQLSQVMINLAEYKPGKHGDGYAWNGEAWIGGDIDRLVIKSEGEGGKALEHAEVQAMWSHALDPYWNLQLGARQDIRPRPGRTYAAVALEGLAPYWFEVEASLFLSNKGDVSARIEAYHDMRLTQLFILQPRIEANFAASDDRATGTGSGLSDAEIGLRLRYEISRQFAPYIGIVHERKFGDTGRLAAAAGDKRRDTRAVLGLRAWF
jgi:copper resistance protein B